VARNPAQDKRLTRGEIRLLKEYRHDPEDLKGNNPRLDLFKDREGNVYVKPKSGQGSGDATGLNLKSLE